MPPAEIAGLSYQPEQGNYYDYESDDDDDDFTGAAEHATRSAGGSGDIFSSVIGSFLGKKNQLANEDIDEQGTHPPVHTPEEKI